MANWHAQRGSARRQWPTKTHDSPQAVMRDAIRPFNARMSAPLRPEVRNLYADGDTVIVFFDAHGTARDGRPYANTYAWFLTMRDDKVVNERSQALDFTRELPDQLAAGFQEPSA